MLALLLMALVGCLPFFQLYNDDDEPLGPSRPLLLPYYHHGMVKQRTPNGRAERKTHLLPSSSFGSTPFEQHFYPHKISTITFCCLAVSFYAVFTIHSPHVFHVHNSVAPFCRHIGEIIQRYSERRGHRNAIMSCDSWLQAVHNQAQKRIYMYIHIYINI